MLDDTCEKLDEVDLAIQKRKGNMSAEEAREIHQKLISCYEDFVKTDFLTGRSPFEKELLISAQSFVRKKKICLENILKPFFTPPAPLPINATPKESESDPTNTTTLNALLLKQKFYIRMIESLEPKGNLNSKAAEIQLKHLNQFYEKFVSNQSEIATIVDAAAFENQIKIAQQVQQTVLDFQTKLEEIFAPNETTASSTESQVNHLLNRTELAHVIVDFIDSQFKKHKSMIEQIELIELQNGPNTVEAESLRENISQLDESFIKNLTQIESYVNGPGLFRELETSRQILQKVISLQLRLQEIFMPAPVPSTSSAPNNQDNQTATNESSDSVTYLKWFLEKQTTLIKQIESLEHNSQDDHERCTAQDVANLSRKLDRFQEWFVSNQKKIELLASKSAPELQKQKTISANIQRTVMRIRAEYSKCHNRP